jgi:hypothetical protein
MAKRTKARKRRKLSRDAADIRALFTRNQIPEIHRAERLFSLRHNPVDSVACACVCHGIVAKREQQPSEAVMARAHAMLAVDGVGWVKDSERL